MIETTASENLKAARSSNSERALEAMIVRFGKDAKANTGIDNAANDLRSLLNSAPELKKQFLQAIEKGSLSKFEVLPYATNAAATYGYTDKSIALSPGILQNAARGNQKDRVELIFLMGHEIQHAFNSTQTIKSREEFQNGVKALAGSNKSPHDYTQLIKNYTASDSRNESSAHIGGFNALVSVVKQGNKSPGLKELYEIHPGRMGDFIIKDESKKPPYSLKPGLSLNADMTMPASNQNIKAMGAYFYGKSATEQKLGPNANLDYKSFIAVDAINFIIQEERKQNKGAAVRMDLQSLGLSSSRVGPELYFPNSKSPPFKYIDGSSGQQTPAQFSPSQERIPTPSPERSPERQKPDQLSEAIIQNPSVNTPQLTALSGNEIKKSLTNDQHANLYQQAFELIGKSSAQLGISNSHAHETAAFNLSSKSLMEGLNRIDQVLPSTKGNGDVFAVQTSQTREHTLRSHIDSQSLLQPVEKTAAQLQQYLQPQPEAQTQALKTYTHSTL
jgi:hypothetical protein